MLHKCNFSIWSRGEDSSFIEDRAFSCYAQAKEGDFTVGKEKLDKIADLLAYNWIYLKIDPNNMAAVRHICKNFGFEYDELLDEEVEYLERAVEEKIRGYNLF